MRWGLGVSRSATLSGPRIERAQPGGVLPGSQLPSALASPPTRPLRERCNERAGAVGLPGEPAG